MMAKITKGASFGGAIRYILDRRKHTELLGADGLRLKDLNAIIGSFETLRQLNPRVSQPLGHISLDFSAQDRETLDNLKIVTIALAYMERMGIRNTQFIIGRHYDREHPHIHILYNRIDNDLKYRYIKMKGEAAPERISELKDIFELHRDNAKIRQFRKDVEEYEQMIREKILLEEQTRLRQIEAEKLDEKAKILKEK